MTGARTGDLRNADELARIISDVEGPKGLLARLAAARSGETAKAPAGTLSAVLENLTGAAAEQRRYDTVPETAAESWKSLRPRSRAFYIASFRPIEAWSESRRHPQVASMKLPDILTFLDLYNDRPAQKAALKRTLSIIFSHAMRMGVRQDHPFGVTLRLRRPRSTAKRAVKRWDAAAVQAYQEAALTTKVVPEAEKWLGGAILIGLMWETSADASDCIAWNRREHFIDDPHSPAIAYARGKTDQDGAMVRTPISRRLADLIRSNGAIYLVTDPGGAPYPIESIEGDARRGYHFRKLKEAVVSAGGPALLLDHLRHSAATDAVEKGSSLEQTRSLTRHKNTAVLGSVYVQFSETQVEAVQRARGIIP